MTEKPNWAEWITQAKQKKKLKRNIKKNWITNEKKKSPDTQRTIISTICVMFIRIRNTRKDTKSKRLICDALEADFVVGFRSLFLSVRCMMSVFGRFVYLKCFKCDELGAQRFVRFVVWLYSLVDIVVLFQLLQLKSATEKKTQNEKRNTCISVSLWFCLIFEQF